MSTKAEDTQKNILDTARKHFLKDGLTGASLRNIVKDAGLTTGAFYKYYPTKEALFDALTDPYMEHIYQIYDQIVEEFEKLSASDQTRNMSDTSSDGMEQMVDYIYDHYDNFRLLLKCGDSGKFELLNDLIINLINVFHIGICQCIKKCLFRRIIFVKCTSSKSGIFYNVS